MRTRCISPKGKLIATCFFTSSVPKLTRYSNECATKNYHKKRKPLFKPLPADVS